MNAITGQLSELLNANVGAPFLFVGSGFSRRYIGLEQWDELLSKFCGEIKEFGYYASKSNNEMPLAASKMASDFNEMWWNSPTYEESRAKNKGLIRNDSSALKLEISNYLNQKSMERTEDDMLRQELDALPRLNVDGIITTNWDIFLEELFPDYKVYVGQEELLFSNPQSVAEIYKIHGCSSQSETLVLTDEDYNLFDQRNSYLAAKLITIFVEHPVIFIGYSLADKNIQKMISSIAACLGQDKLDQFGRNLIFLQRCSNGEAESFSPSIINIGDINLNISVIRTDNFMTVYDAIEASKRKIPTRILRYCKEQMYDLVKDADTEGKMAVVDIDQIDGKEDVEFVVGVGVATLTDRITQRGYSGISLDEIFSDVINDEVEFDPNKLLSGVYPTLFKQSNKYIPAYKYLRLAGINSLSELRASQHSKVEALLKKSKVEKIPAYQRQYDKNFRGKSTSEIIEGATPEKVTIMLLFQDDAEIDIDDLQKFLLGNADKLQTSKSNYASYFRKLACHYDRLKYGFDIDE